MRFSISSVCVLVLSLVSVNAFVIRDAPAEATTVKHQHAIDRIPEPTAGPGVQELRRRQAATQKTLLGAPDNTCGYLNGDSSQPWGCAVGSDCFFATATPLPANSTKTQAAGSILCCDPKDGCPAAPAPTACVDRGQYDYNKTCTGSCPTDSMTLKCTSGIYLYCNTLTFEAPSASALFCNYLSTYDVLPAVTAHALTPTLVQFAGVPTTSSSISSTKTSSTASHAATSTTASSAPSTGSKSSPNKGKIIAGVLGGLAGLVLIALLVIFFLRWRNSREVVEPVKEEVVMINGKEGNGSGTGAKVAGDGDSHSPSTSDQEVGVGAGAGAGSQGGCSGRNSALAGSTGRSSSGKKVRVVG